MAEGKKLKIVSVSSEISPFSKTGGLGDVARSLPLAIKNNGHEIIAITPLYNQVIDKNKYKLKLIFEKVKIYLNSKDHETVNYWEGRLEDDIPVYFIENKKYFSKKKELYGSTHENARFLTFDVAALKLISMLGFKADIIHCHDWHTGLIPHYLKNDFCYSKTLKKAKTIYTIHNLVFQMGRNWWQIPPAKKDTGRTKIPHITNPDIEYVNFAKRAIMSADIINTVSEQYREEILTKVYGADLHKILKKRSDKLFGIINGIDENHYNPKNDPGLAKNYDFNKPNHKKENKLFLQKKFSLPQDADIPLICCTSRITYQKGFNLILKILELLTKLNLQIIITGGGDKEYIKSLKKMEKKYPKKIRVLASHEENQKYETLMYAGSDFFLLPSYYEPCGINQLKAMRYGCVPIVRKVGGLQDTVQNFNPATRKGTGFSFEHFNEWALYGAIIRALENFKMKENWSGLVARIMQESNDWEIPAKKYIALYKRALRLNKK